MWLPFSVFVVSRYVDVQSKHHAQLIAYMLVGVIMNWSLFAYSHFAYSRFTYFRPKSGVSPTHKKLYIWASNYILK